jgi:hypothetical protein
MNIWQRQKEREREKAQEEYEELMLEDKRLETLEILEQMALGRFECPHCNEPLEHFGGLEQIPEYYYCPKCMDWAYSDSGHRLFQLV